MSINTAMTSLANSIRKLIYKTNKMSIEDMTNSINTECDSFENNVNIQNDLLTQIDSALREKGV